MGIRLKDLSKLGYRDNVARSLAVALVGKYCKHETKEQILAALGDILKNPEVYKNSEIWSKLAEHLSPVFIEKRLTPYDLLDEPLGYKTYGSKYIETLAKQQMNLAMRLPITLAGALMPDAHAGYGLPIGGVLATDHAVIPYAVGVDIGCRMNLAMRLPITLAGALMPDAHAGYGLPIGGVLATDHAVIPYAVGVDIGCRMNLTLFDAGEDFLKRYSHHIKEALKEFTHFGMDGGLPFAQEHEVLDREEFRMTELLRGLHGKAIRQLGSSGGGNHFVEFGKMSLQAGNVLGVPEGNYVALLSHSGSRGLGAAIAKHYSLLARDLCRLPREAQHFAWLGLDTEEGQEYWLSMNLAGDYARACHERIHQNLSKALGLKPLANVNNHHNFAWKEEIAPGQTAIVHRKGATPAQKGQPGLIPGSMATPGYLVCGKGISEALCSASHGAGRAMSRQKAKDNFTRSALRKYLSQAGVTLIGGSVEEMPLAYKDIDRVMKTQEELVEVQGTFMPCIVRMNKE